MPNEPLYLYLTTTGWRSGSPHRIEIWFVAHDGRYYLVSEKREQSHWVQNIRRNPAVTFHVEDKAFAGTGRIVDPAQEPELAAAVSALMDAKYEWSDGLIVELAPIAEPITPP
ncbi:MAG: nitroreductase family deazaflavin-dependent oxidoreductase [Anaerolineae bacterium]|nr:nitroreductase family deazaflavin-dependent oxidoreductase [Anaerolineae bacterium]